MVSVDFGCESTMHFSHFFYDALDLKSRKNKSFLGLWKLATKGRNALPCVSNCLCE
jgi:hypothetical protein